MCNAASPRVQWSNPNFGLTHRVDLLVIAFSGRFTSDCHATISMRIVVEQLTLTVVQGNDAALALYQKYELQPYGMEPRALKTAAGYADEVLMWRQLV